MDKRELKKISLEFRQMASRVLHSHYNDFYRNLQMFVGHIQQTDLLIGYIKSLPDTGADMDAEVDEVAKNFGRYIFDFGSSKDEQVVNSYRLLSSSRITEQNILDLCTAYCPGSHKFQDAVNSFGKRVILPFVNYLENYLTEIGIDMGMDDSVQYKITVNGGQVNLAQDNSTISAVQNNSGIDFNHLQELIDSIQLAVSNGNVTPATSTQISELLAGIKEELQKQSPKKSVISMLLNGLTSTANLLGAIPIVSQKVEELARYIGQHI